MSSPITLKIAGLFPIEEETSYAFSLQKKRQNNKRFLLETYQPLSPSKSTTQRRSPLATLFPYPSSFGSTRRFTKSKKDQRAVQRLFTQLHPTEEKSSLLSLEEKVQRIEEVLIRKTLPLDQKYVSPTTKNDAPYIAELNQFLAAQFLEEKEVLQRVSQKTWQVFFSQIATFSYNTSSLFVGYLNCLEELIEVKLETQTLQKITANILAAQKQNSINLQSCRTCLQEIANLPQTSKKLKKICDKNIQDLNRKA